MIILLGTNEQKNFNYEPVSPMTILTALYWSKKGEDTQIIFKIHSSAMICGSQICFIGGQKVEEYRTLAEIEAVGTV